MSDEQKTNQDAQDAEKTIEQQSQSTELKTENMVPSYRLKEEADKKRAVQAELDELKKEKQEREEAELSELDKTKKQLDKVTTEFNDFKVAAAQKDLNVQFTQKVIDAGLPSKIANVAVPFDLSEDNMADKVKDAVKEFSDFIKPENESLGASQPASSPPKGKKYKTFADEAADKATKK